MMHGSWKRFVWLGFILGLLLSGCGEKRVPTEEIVRQAEDLINVGQLDSAILLLERRLEEEPNRVDLLEPLAFAQAARKDLFLAAITFKRIADLLPDQPEYLLYAAELLEQADDSRGAAALMSAYLDVRPRDRAVLVGLAELQAAAGQNSDALEAYLAAEQLESRGPQQLAIARLYLNTGNLAQAQVWFARALASDAELRDAALLGLLETAVRARQFQEATLLLERLDAEFPGELDASPIAEVRGQLKEWQSRRAAALAALAELERQQSTAMEVAVTAPETPPEEQPAPTVPNAAAEIQPEVSVAVQATSTETATAQESALPTLPDATTVLANARQQLAAGDTGAAIQTLRQFLVGNDQIAAVWAELSALHLEAGEARWAQATASEAVRRDPENVEYTLQFLRAAKLNLNAERYLREVEDAYRRFPSDVDVVLTLARVYAEEGINRNARLLYLRCLEMIPFGDPRSDSVRRELEALGG